ncbi:3604_t:CDS:2, partial [Acaulospora colombiana]
EVPNEPRPQSLTQAPTSGPSGLFRAIDTEASAPAQATNLSGMRRAKPEARVQSNRARLVSLQESLVTIKAKLEEAKENIITKASPMPDDTIPSVKPPELARAEEAGAWMVELRHTIEGELKVLQTSVEDARSSWKANYEERISIEVKILETERAIVEKEMAQQPIIF